MSQHFTYELDEQVLRNQIQELRVSFRDEAWQRFEAYSLTQEKPVSRGAFQKIQLKLNRNVVLPAGFGVVVLAFSLLLFNFVNIKDTGRADIDASQAVCPVVHTPEPADNITVPAAEVNNRQADIILASEQKVTPVHTVAEPQPASAIVSDQGAIGAADASVKPRKRRIPAETLSEIRPTMVTEDLEPEIRPN